MPRAAAAGSRGGGAGGGRPAPAPGPPPPLPLLLLLLLLVLLPLLPARPVAAAALEGPAVPPPAPAAPEEAFLLCAFDTCQCSASLLEMTCRGASFTRLPQALPPSLEKLDLSSNNITELPEGGLAMLPNLTELILTDNSLERIHARAFRGLHRLRKLSLDRNSLSALSAHSLAGLPRLQALGLAANRLASVPGEALAPLRDLRELTLSSNQLTQLTQDSFPQLPNLTKLVLRRNQIVSIEERAFANLWAVAKLELDDNALAQLPEALRNLSALQELSLSGNRLSYLPWDVLQHCPALTRLELRGNPVRGVHPLAFTGLPRLRKLILSDTRELTHFPALNGTAALEELYLDRASLAAAPAALCRTCPGLRSLVLKSNKLTHVPELDGCGELRLLDLSSNRISGLEGRPFRHLGKLHDLMLAHNAIAYLPEHAFQGLAGLQRLDLESNGVEGIHPRAFVPFTKLQDLNLGNNVFPQLPALGMGQLLHLKAFNNPALRQFPPPDSFPRVQTLALAYAYHCCAFLPLVHAEPPPPAVVETIIYPGKEVDIGLWSNSSADLWPQMHNMSKKFGSQMNHLWDKFGNDFTYPGALPSDEYFEEQEAHLAGSDAPPNKVQCMPLPGPFLPCQDLFDWWTLRCGVWIVFLLAMLGNGTVVFVLIFSRSKMDVPRFLVCNLAAADFFMGIYLGFLAVVDASTLGEFRMYAIPWQMSAGCQLAGFLGVLSSELSVYTLAVITLERNYAITHAMHLNKRLSLRHAGYIMACGWTFALVMALLPLLGVSDYRKFAVCLPFETAGAASLAYVVFLMFINGVAFLILMGCYLKMYCAIRGSQAWNSNDSRIAKRMALLVFTDFVCWSPIAFFSLTAAFGLQLVSLEQAKVFTVFVLPLNSCCNPFLYAILTKQFKKDCVLICKAIEESRVTRGIGRCRHSSNFSNRQTPANTNSLVDRSSRDHQAQQCTCSAKLLGDSGSGGPGARGSASGAAAAGPAASPRAWLLGKAGWLLLCLRRDAGPRHRARSDQYAYQIAEIQQKQHKRASSVSSSENFSSSRSDSWRQHHHHCGIPLRLLDPKRRASSWLVTRKTSQDSNLSSSRNDSSGSATTASTSTWRLSRSSASSDARAFAQAAVLAAERAPLTGGPAAVQHAAAAAAAAAVAAEPGAGPAAAAATAAAVRARAKPRLTRQSAVVQEDTLEPVPLAASPGPGAGSPGRLAVRFLATIPSAAESLAGDDEPPAEGAAGEAAGSPAAPAPAAAPFYAILHSSPPHTTIVPRCSAGDVTVHHSLEGAQLPSQPAEQCPPSPPPPPRPPDPQSDS